VVVHFQNSIYVVNVAKRDISRRRVPQSFIRWIQISQIFRTRDKFENLLNFCASQLWATTGFPEEAFLKASTLNCAACVRSRGGSV
jgi:hypothetical protein